MACAILARPAAESFEGRFSRVEDSVDHLIASCKPKVRPSLPGAGRDLVPYFGTEEVPNQALSDIGSHIRKKKGQNSKVVQSRHSSTNCPQDSEAVAQLKHSKGPGNTRNRAEPASGCKAGRRTDSAAKMAVSKSVPNVSTLPAKYIPVNKSWAGPSFYNSPAPECLPLPTAYLLAV